MWESTFNLDFIFKINEYVARNESREWGVLRNGHIGITGTDYTPDIPIRDKVEADLEKILSLKSVTERAIRYFLWGCRSQLFWDGNKRTSTICANKILISEGKGLLTIREQYLMEFNERLSKYYDSNDYSLIEGFIYDKCIIGIKY